MKKEIITPPPCHACDALCCRYVAIQIDKPTEKRDFDNIRWYLLHKNVQVFRDLEKDWFIEFITPCEQLGPDNACLVYDQRPRICREHGEPPMLCEQLDNPYLNLFQTVADLDAYLAAKKARKK
ncbi:MAG: hypothetical protein EOM20_17875 [Spartobacteria bacterium]|nr:hypothetical protein [Spartobacteria bacterium]